MSFLKFYLAFTDIFLSMHVPLYPYLLGVHPPLSILGSMDSKRARSKEIDRSATRVVVERVSTSLLICEDTKLIVDKDIKQKWQEFNYEFVTTFSEVLECHQVYVNIHKFHSYLIACRYLILPCTHMIHWIISHIGPEMMKSSSVSGMEISTFRAEDYDDMYQILKLMIIMKTPFNIANNNSNSRDILKNWLKELAKFRMTTNQTYKTKIMQKAYQYLVIFSCRMNGK